MKDELNQNEHKHEHGCCCQNHGSNHHHEHEHECSEHQTHEHNHLHGGIECGCHHHHEEKEVSVKTIIFSAILFALGIIVEHFGLYFIPKGAYQETIHQGLSLLLFFLPYLLCGKSILISAVKNLFEGHVLDEQFLMAVSSIGAIILKQYPEAVAIIILFQVGEKFEHYAVQKSRNSIAEIAKLRPEVAFVKEGTQIVERKIEQVEIGSIIVVRPGERIPLDGIVVNGESFLDTSALTGESVPRKVMIDDEILSGCINKQGVLEIQTTKKSADSALSRILELVENATENKTKQEQFVTRFAKIYTPIVCIAAVMLAVIPPVFGADFKTWIYRSLMFLVVSCPCAIVLSIPLSFCGGITAAARKGILIKGSIYLETLAKTKIAVFDKTGTLTKGVFNVSDVHTMNDFSQEELIAIATHAEYYSTHPISSSLKAIHHSACCEQYKPEFVDELAGFGIKAIVNGKEVLAGNLKLMEKFNVEYEKCEEHQNGTIVHLAIDKKYAGHIVISDEVKEDSLQAINDLKKCGVKDIVMLTGDNKATAENVAQELGITHVYSELLSQDKLSKVEELLADLNKSGKKGDSLIFTGDGINDSPVLARADAGIAMGGVGSDAAIEAADIIIMEDKPSKIAEGIKISRKTVGIVYQNLIGSLGIKGIILILSAFGISNMWLAVFGDVGVTILAVLNALRLLRK